MDPHINCITTFTATSNTFEDRGFRECVLERTKRLRPWHYEPGYGKPRPNATWMPAAHPLGLSRKVPGRRGACGRKGY